jgi:hypothetical protein
VTTVENVGYCTWKGLARKIARAPRKEIVVFFGICSHPDYLLRRCSGYFSSQTFHVQYPTFSTAVTLHIYPLTKMEQTGCSETLAFKLQMPGNNPEENIQQAGKCCLRANLLFVVKNMRPNVPNAVIPSISVIWYLHAVKHQCISRVSEFERVIFLEYSYLSNFRNIILYT